MRRRKKLPKSVLLRRVLVVLLGGSFVVILFYGAIQETRDIQDATGVVCSLMVGVPLGAIVLYAVWRGKD